MDNRTWEELRYLEMSNAHQNKYCAICGVDTGYTYLRFGPCGIKGEDIYPYHIVNKYSWMFCDEHKDSISKDSKDAYDNWLDDFENAIYDLVRHAEGDKREFYMSIIGAANKAVEEASKWRIDVGMEKNND